MVVVVVVVVVVTTTTMAVVVMAICGNPTSQAKRNTIDR